MVNGGVVNGPASYLLRATFCDFFPALGRFLRFKNPVKYTGRFEINHKSAHPATPASAGRAEMAP